MLLALGALSRGKTSLPFAEVEPRLTELLREFGPARLSLHPEYPFWRLQNDRVWEVKAGPGLELRKGHDDPTRTSLRQANASGELAKEVRERLLAEPGRIEAAARVLLDENFPETLHQDLLDAVALTVDRTKPSYRRPRSPNIRNAVLMAYRTAPQCSIHSGLARSAGGKADKLGWR